MEKDPYGKPITGKLAELEAENKEKANHIKDLEKKAKAKVDEHHVAHAKTFFIDFGELGLQFGVVLCSLAILLKSRGMWVTGLGSSAIGFVIALAGQFGLFVGLAAHH